MKATPTTVDYGKLRLSNLFSEQYRHILLLLYWPVYGFVFWYAEQVHPVDYYFPMYCKLDDLIPFNELFVIPYLLWFVFLIGMQVYTFFADVPVFKQMLKFVILTYTTALVIFFLFPNCQELRPQVFPRDNILTRFMAGFYEFDTNTNVCPSLHVIGSLGSMFAAWKAKGLQAKGFKIAAFILAFFISISTVFLKQHSILDVFVALPICAIGYFLCFRQSKCK